MMSDRQFQVLRWVTHNVLAGALVIVSFLASLSWIVQSHETRKEAADFALATKYARVGRWTWDMTAPPDSPKALTWDDVMMQIYGTTRTEWSKKTGYHAWFDRVHPADKEFVQSRIDSSVQNRSGYSAVFRAIGDDGSIRYVLATGAVVTSGKYMTGICMLLDGSRFNDLYRVLPPLVSSPFQSSNIPTQ